MKIGNVILAIFFWLCIPSFLVLGLFLGAMAYATQSGGEETKLW